MGQPRARQRASIPAWLPEQLLWIRSGGRPSCGPSSRSSCVASARASSAATAATCSGVSRCEAQAIASSSSGRSSRARTSGSAWSGFEDERMKQAERRVAGDVHHLAATNRDGVNSVHGLDHAVAAHLHEQRLRHAQEPTQHATDPVALAAVPFGAMPELPEMEAWRRQLDEPVAAFAGREGGAGAHRDAEDVRPAARGARGPAAQRREPARQAPPLPHRGRRARPPRAPHDRGPAQVPADRREVARSRRPSGSSSTAAASSSSRRTRGRSAPASGC